MKDVKMDMRENEGNKKKKWWRPELNTQGLKYTNSGATTDFNEQTVYSAAPAS